MKTQIESLLIVIQRLNFEWGKEAKGGEMAAHQTQAMANILLPAKLPSKSTIALVQQLDFSDVNAFAEPRERVYEYANIVSAYPGELELKFDNNILRLLPYSFHPSGKVKITELRASQTARFECNERIVLEHTWRYKHVRLNIGLVNGYPHRNLFFNDADFYEAYLSQMY